MTHKPTGIFCYGFFPHGNRPSAMATVYRGTMMGPGVMPDLYWESSAPAAYNPEFDRAADVDQRELLGDSKACQPR